MQHPPFLIQQSFKQIIFPSSILQQVFDSQQDLSSQLQQLQGQTQHLFNFDSKSQQVLI